VIVAGGRGTRLRPLTNSVPKSMVLVLGKPFLHWLIKRLCTQNISRFLILTGYKASMIEEYFGDGSKFGIFISYSHEDSPLGTGGALWAASELLEHEFLYVNGDDYQEIDYTELVDAFHSQNVLAMVAACEDSYGLLEIDKKTKFVTRFTANNGPNLPYLDCGTKVFKKSVLNLLSLKPPFNLESSLWPELIQRNQLALFHISSKAQGIDTPEKLNHFTRWLKTTNQILPIKS
jgi:mannose-1-phosphate guanylyltransferase